MNEILENLATVINTEELKQTVNISKALHENIASIEKTTQEDSSSTELVIEQAKQGELVKKLQSALLVVQEQIFDNYQQLESVCDTDKLQQVADITVNLQTNLAAVVTVSDKAQEEELTKSEFDIPSTTVAETIASQVGETVSLEQAELAKLEEIAKEQVKPTAVDSENIAMGISTEAISQEDQVVTKEVPITETVPASAAESIIQQIEEKAVVSKVTLEAAGEIVVATDSLETSVEVAEKLTETDYAAVSAKIEPVALESVTVGESVVMDGVQAIKTTETVLAEPKLGMYFMIFWYLIVNNY